MSSQVPVSKEQEEIGFTQSFVLARGFVQVDGFDALIGPADEGYVGGHDPPFAISH